jgi:hypothetical protein
MIHGNVEDDLSYVDVLSPGNSFLALASDQSSPPQTYDSLSWSVALSIRGPEFSGPETWTVSMYIDEAVSFLPVVGDLVADPYFAARSLTSCALGSCDALNLGADVGAISLPGGAYSNVARLRRAADLGIGLVAGFTRTVSRVDEGFESFAAFKRVYGYAPPGYEWHHIVTQNPANIAKFGPRMIHHANNLVLVQKPTHDLISRYYARILVVLGWAKGKGLDWQVRLRNAT